MTTKCSTTRCSDQVVKVIGGVCVGVCVCASMYLWDCKTGNGEAGDEVTYKLAGGVGCDPVEDGEDESQANEGFVGAALTLELVEGGIMEERLPYPIRNLLHNAAFRRHHHLVHQRHLLAALTAAVIRVWSHVIP